MAILNLSINRREYEIACNDGEEQHLLNLSYELDRRVKELSKAVGTGNQSLLLVVAALQLVDELYIMRTGGGQQQADIQSEVDRISSATISQLTSKLEDLARKIEKKTA